MNFFKNQSLGSKILLTTVSGGFCIILIGLVNFFTMNKVLSLYDHVIKINLASEEKLGVMRTRVARIATKIYQAQHAYLNGESIDPYFKEIDNHLSVYEKAESFYREIPFLPGLKELYVPVSEGWSKNKSSIEKIHEIMKSNKDLAKKDELNDLIENFEIDVEEQIKATIAIVDFQTEDAAQWTQQAKSSANLGQMSTAAGIAIFFTLSILMGLLLSRSIARNLRNLANDLNKEADEVTKASQEIAGTAQQLSQATTEQAASLEETAASIEEMASMIGKNSENSSNTASLASQSHASATQGEQVVNSMITSMAEINASNQNIMNAINQSNNEISQIIKVITEIGNKTKVINDIVFQTKLLSFNASVEAARAGEHGKGFAVVAEEVGNLAEMSGNAAKEISGMLEESILKVETIVRDTQTRVEGLIDEGRSKVEQGTNIAQNCGEVLREIVENVGKVTSMAEEISAASSEQSKGITEISKAMSQLDHVTQQNAQTSDVTAGSSQQLSRQAVNLRNSVQKLMAEIDGSGHKNNLSQEAQSYTPTEKNYDKKENVIPFKQKHSKNKIQDHAKKSTPISNKAKEKPLAMVSGGGFSSDTPSKEDDRFEDV